MILTFVTYVKREKTKKQMWNNFYENPEYFFARRNVWYDIKCASGNPLPIWLVLCYLKSMWITVTESSYYSCLIRSHFVLVLLSWAESRYKIYTRDKSDIYIRSWVTNRFWCHYSVMKKICNRPSYTSHFINVYFIF